MELNPTHKDALTELINIGYGRTAGALSELTGYRITLEVPRVDMHEIDAIVPMLEAVITSHVASIDQRFAGPVSGSALLLLEQEAAVVLSQLLTEEVARRTVLDANTREILTELGNILLNACLGVFGNLLGLQMTFAVPRLQVDTVDRILASIAESSDEQLRYGLMVHTRFSLKTGQISGYLVIILGLGSLDRLLAELERWEQGQLD